jgi:hypothetical protein
MRKLILSLAVLGSAASLTGCEYVGMFDSSIKPEVTGDGPKEPGGVSPSPEVPATHSAGENAHTK